MLNQLDVAASDPRPTAHYSDGLLEGFSRDLALGPRPGIQIVVRSTIDTTPKGGI